MTDRQFVAKLYQEGKSGIQVGNIVGLTYGRVYQILREDNVPKREPPPPKPKEPPPPKPQKDRVVDKILRFLADHPLSTVIQITEGIGHENQATVGALLSRLKTRNVVASSQRVSFHNSHKLWALASNEQDSQAAAE